ncbi:19012_t:CDS:2 [Cetraspora pellucida]|uniref:19012_t:CDS:1 n=1 Tax=Cetraspora pellucida TaxID=1433469 RepID=A0A9N8VFT0_9GLOM|nr:19012_t:CDS:2 [Cetraspora pellucida]
MAHKNALQDISHLILQDLTGNVRGRASNVHDNEDSVTDNVHDNVHDNEDSVTENPFVVETPTVEDEDAFNYQAENSAAVNNFESDAVAEASTLEFPFGACEFSGNNGPLLDQNIEENEFPLGPCICPEINDPILNQYMGEIMSSLQ